MDKENLLSTNIMRPLKNNHINVIPKQNSGFDIWKASLLLDFIECQILNFAEESLFY